MYAVLDTSVASFLLSEDGRAGYYRPHLAGAIPTLSFQTVAELRKGALRANWGQDRRNNLESFMRQFYVHPYDDRIASEWARIMYEAEMSGARFESADGWIAATASVLDAPLLTHDADFNQTSCPGIRIVRYDDAGSAC